MSHSASIDWDKMLACSWGQATHQSSWHLDATNASWASHVHSLIPKFLWHRELLKEIGPELKHVFVKFRLKTGHQWIHRNLDEGITRFFNIGWTSESRETSRWTSTTTTGSCHEHVIHDGIHKFPQQIVRNPATPILPCAKPETNLQPKLTTHNSSSASLWNATSLRPECVLGGGYQP